MIALLSDIHGNLEALSACLRHAKDTGATRYAFLGDYVGYGADPQGVVDLVADYSARGAIAVKGNHDEAVEKTPGYMNDTSREIIAWTRQRLGEPAKAFLCGLPLVARDEGVLFVHSSAAAPERWDYVDSPAAAQKSMDAANCAYTFSGHVHGQELFYNGAEGRVSVLRPMPGRSIPVTKHRRWLALVGSVGQPRDGNPAAAYAIFDLAGARLRFFRVPYDHHAAARKIRDAGLPASVAYRVEQGI